MDIKVRDCGETVLVSWSLGGEHLHSVRMDDVTLSQLEQAIHAHLMQRLLAVASGPSASK